MKNGRLHNFSKLWFGQTVSMFGSQIGEAALRYTALLLLAAGPQQLAWLTAATLLPTLLLALPTGLWVDRLRRRPLLIGADLGRAGLLLVLPALFVFGQLRIELLYALAATLSALSIVFDTAYHSFVPALVAREQLVKANSRLGMSESLTEMAGPPLGGLLVQLLSAPFAVLFDALSFLASAFALWRIDVREAVRPIAAQTSSLAELREGLGFLLGDTRLRALLGCTMTHTLGGGMFYALYELYLIRDLGYTPALVGLTVGMGGVGSLLGAFLAEPLARRLGIGRTLLGAQLVFSLSNVVIPFLHGPVAVTLPLLMLTQFADLSYTVYAIHQTSLRQTIVPEHLLGRIASLFTLLTTATLLLGALAGGAIADSWGARLALGAAVVIGMLSSLWLLALGGYGETITDRR